MKLNDKHFGLWLAGITTIGLSVVVVFLSSGLNVPGYGDEWPMIAAADAVAPINFQRATRNFLDIPFRISYLLSPDSFAGYSLYQAVMIAARGILVYILFRLLCPNRPALALVSGTLAAFYPGDVAAYVLSNVHYLTAIALYLLALIMLVKYWQTPRGKWLVAMAAAQILCVGMYEGSVPLILASPLILIYLQQGVTRRVVRTAAFWFIMPALYAARIVILTGGGQGLEYQTAMVNPDNSLPELIGGVVEVFAREFGRIWLWAELTIPQGLSDARTWVILLVTLLFGGALWLHTRAERTQPSLRNDLLFIAAGMVVLALSYAPFAITIFRYSFFRTILFGLFGAAVVVAVLFHLAARAPLLMRLMLAGVFIIYAVFLLSNTDRLSAILAAMIGAGFLVPHDKRYAVLGAGVVGYALAFNIGFRTTQPYADLPERQQRLVTAIVQQAPAVKNHTLLLFISTLDVEEQPFAVVRNRYDILQAILQYVYKNHAIEAQLCIPGAAAWGEYITSCELRQDEVLVRAHGSTLTWSYDRVVAFEYQEGNALLLLQTIPSAWMSESGAGEYNPDALIDLSAPLSYRLTTVWSDTSNIR